MYAVKGKLKVDHILENGSSTDCHHFSNIHISKLYTQNEDQFRQNVFRRPFFFFFLHFCWSRIGYNCSINRTMVLAISRRGVSL